MFLKVDFQADGVEKTLSDAAKKQVPFAIARALTAMAFELRRAEQSQLRSTFKHPRPFTQRGVLVEKATKGVPVATVYLRPEVDRYLAPYEFGGDRLMPGRGLAFVIPVAARTDQYGQLIGQPSALKDGPNRFYGSITFKKSGQTVTGFWERPAVGERRDGTRGTKGNTQGLVGGTRTGLKLLAEIDPRKKPVSPKLQFTQVAQKLVQARARLLFDDALNKALGTAK